MNTLGKKIAELRKSRSMTQETLARQIGVSPQAVSRWENGATMPDIMLLPVLADILDTTINELFSEDGPAPIEYDFDIAPQNAYLSVLDVLCKNFDSSGEYQAEQLYQELKSRRGIQAGISATNNNGTVYATDDLAIAYLTDDSTSMQLFENEHIASFFAALSDSSFRRTIKYLFEKKIPLTPASASARTGIPESDALNALLDITKFGFAVKKEIDNGVDNIIFVFEPIRKNLLHMLLLPMMRIANLITDNSNTWNYFRGV